MNNFRFNDSQFNADYNYKIAENDKLNFTFAGFDLMELCKWDTGIAIQSFNGYNVQNVNLTTFESQMADGGGVVSRRFTPKSLTLVVVVQGKDHNDLIRRLDELKGAVSDIEQPLDLMIWETKRRYIVTLAGVTIPDFKKLDDHIEWVTLDFIASSAHWYDPKPVQSVILNERKNKFTKIVTNKGNYKVYPVIKLLTHAGNSTSSVSITHKVMGEAEGYKITIPHSVGEHKLITIDYGKKIVKIDDTEVDFDWIFMPMQKGQTFFDFNIEWSVNLSVYVLHNPTYL